MDTTTQTHPNGRKYEVLVEGELTIIVGPPDGLVDSLGLQEPFSTNLHNALHRRKLYNYESISRDPKSLYGALQETLLIDVQRLTEMFWRYENPSP